MVNFEEIEEIFKKLEGKLTPEAFRSKVETKFTEMTGIRDPRTAAMLVASALGLNENIKIKDMTADKGKVIVNTKVTCVGDIKEFSRDNDTMGRVVNLNLADETGSIRAALWDDAADLVKIGNLKMGHTIKVKGFVKQGQRGIEINVGKGGGIEHIEKEVNVNIKPQKINEIKAGMTGLNVLGKVLDLGKVRTFSRKDGNSGKVANITIGDDTGKIRVTLWDAKAENPGVKVGEIVEVMNAYARENSFSNSTELQLGSGGGITKSGADVNYN